MSLVSRPQTLYDKIKHTLDKPKEPGQLAQETFAAVFKTRLHLKWDYEHFSQEEKAAWAAVERAVVDAAARSVTIRPENAACAYCEGALEEGPTCPVSFWECPFPPEPHTHMQCSQCGQGFIKEVSTSEK